ncbi:helix-turn-helix domain-containing protein [Rhodovibrio sodomensis]
MAAQWPRRLRCYEVHSGARWPGRRAARRSRARGVRLTEANDAARRRHLEIVGEFPALPEDPEKPAVVRQATVFRIYPNKAQEEALPQWAGAGRWFWNKCVESNQQLYALEGRFAFHGELSALLPEMKSAESLAEGATGIHLVDVSRRFDKALRDFLDDRRAVRGGRKTAAKAKDFPQFRSKRERDVSVYLSGDKLTRIRRQAADVGKARGWVERPRIDDTQVWIRVKRQGRIGEKRVNVRHAIRLRGGRWPARSRTAAPSGRSTRPAWSPTPGPCARRCRGSRATARCPTSSRPPSPGNASSTPRPPGRGKRLNRRAARPSRAEPRGRTTRRVGGEATLGGADLVDCQPWARCLGRPASPHHGRCPLPSVLR